MRLHLVLVTCLISHAASASTLPEPDVFSYVRVIPGCRDIATGKNLVGNSLSVYYQGFCGGVLFTIREGGIKGDPKSTCVPDEITVIDMVRELEKDFKDTIVEYNKSHKGGGMTEEIAGLMPFELDARASMFKKWPCKGR